MHAACSSNGNGCRHAPETSPTDRLGTAFAETAASPENGAGGRDAKGRFAPGNAGGPGNPFARRVAELRREFLAEATGEDLRAVCRALLERAQGGDVAAAKLALSYLLGKPERAVDPDTLDEHEWQIHRRSTAPGEWVELIQTLPLDVVLPLVRAVWPVLARAKVAQAEPLFAVPAPAPQEPAREAGGDKPRTRRRGGTGRRSEAEESSPGTEGPTAELPTEEFGPEEAGPPDGSAAAGEVTLDGDYPESTQETTSSQHAAVDRQAGRLSYDAGQTRGVAAEPPVARGTPAAAGSEGERPGPGGQAGTRTRAEGPGEPSRRPAAGQARPVAPGKGAGARGGSGAGGGKRCPSANGGDGAAPAAGAAVNKRDHRQDRAGRRQG